jgi:HAD superfamily hydrolase (TIGR01549 family)
VTTAAVLFDLDDTLFDHWGCTRAALGAVQVGQAAFGAWAFEAFEAAHRELLEALHLEVLAGRLTVDDARLARFRRLFEQAGQPASDALVRETAAAYRRTYLAHRQPVRGARDLLAALHGRVRTGIVSNNVAAEQYQKIDECGFAPYLDAIVISEEAGVAKPDPRIFDLALDRLCHPRQAAVMVGDAWTTDIAGAQAAGIRPVWFNRFGAVSPDKSVREIDSLEPADTIAERILMPDPLGAEARAKAAESRT